MSDEVTLEGLADALEKLRDEWATVANAIESFYGQDEPSAKAIRRCISDVHRAMNPDLF